MRVLGGTSVSTAHHGEVAPYRQRWILHLVATSLVVAMGLAAWFAVGVFLTVKEKSKAKTTAFNMGRVDSVLRAYWPSDMSRPALAELMRKYDDPRFLVDAWGNEILVEMSQRSAGEAPSYTVRSLGRDGLRGPCCTGFVGHDWDADAMLRDGEWLQVW